MVHLNHYRIFKQIPGNRVCLLSTQRVCVNRMSIRVGLLLNACQLTLYGSTTLSGGCLIRVSTQASLLSAHVSLQIAHTPVLVIQGCMPRVGMTVASPIATKRGILNLCITLEIVVIICWQLLIVPCPVKVSVRLECQ